MIKGRDIRRHHNKRLKEKRKTYWGRQWEEEKMTPRQLGIVLHTPAICSCWMCGNDRKHQKQITIQERRMMQDTE